MDYEWDVTRCTTDKLADELNDFAWDIHQIQYIGGRDWVIITKNATAQATDQKPFYIGVYRGYAKRAKGNRYWEITLPGAGLDGEDLMTQARHAAEIDTQARDAIAVSRDIHPLAFDVEIDVETTQPSVVINRA